MDLFGIACNILFYVISGIGEILKLFGMTCSWWYRLRTLRHNEVKSFLKDHYYFRKCILSQQWVRYLKEYLGKKWVCILLQKWVHLIVVPGGNGLQCSRSREGGSYCSCLCSLNWQTVPKNSIGGNGIFSCINLWYQNKDVIL